MCYVAIQHCKFMGTCDSCIFLELDFTKKIEIFWNFFHVNFCPGANATLKQELKTVKTEDDLLICQPYYFLTRLKEVI